MSDGNDEAIRGQFAFCREICIMAVRGTVKTHLKDVVEKDGYFTGWIDEEINLNNFLRDYEVAGSTSFKLRSSALRGSGKRYRNEGIEIDLICEYNIFIIVRYFIRL